MSIPLGESLACTVPSASSAAKGPAHLCNLVFPEPSLVPGTLQTLNQCLQEEEKEGRTPPEEFYKARLSKSNGSADSSTSNFCLRSFFSKG